MVTLCSADDGTSSGKYVDNETRLTQNKYWFAFIQMIHCVRSATQYFKSIISNLKQYKNKLFTYNLWYIWLTPVSDLTIQSTEWQKHCFTVCEHCYLTNDYAQLISTQLKLTKNWN